MQSLNYKHLKYFWVAAKAGGIARAAQQLHVTPHTISGQLGEFQETLGVELFRRAGRGLELTDAGRRILGYAEDIFAMGDELLEALRNHAMERALPFRVGIADSVSKSVACQLVEPALGLRPAVRLVCREGRLTSLLAELAIHRLDMIIADRPMPANLNVRGYSHLLGESGLTVFGAAALAQSLPGAFPARLDNAPFLLPGEDVAIRQKLIQWVEAKGLRLRIVGEFDDSALVKSFGQAGAGLFVAPTAIAGHVCEQYKVEELGRIDAVVEQVYAITSERRITHPAVAAISESARRNVFKAAGAPNGKAGARRKR